MGGHLGSLLIHWYSARQDTVETNSVVTRCMNESCTSQAVQSGFIIPYDINALYNQSGQATKAFTNWTAKGTQCLQLYFVCALTVNQPVQSRSQENNTTTIIL